MFFSDFPDQKISTKKWVFPEERIKKAIAEAETIEEVTRLEKVRGVGFLSLGRWFWLDFVFFTVRRSFFFFQILDFVFFCLFGSTSFSFETFWAFSAEIWC